jgi:hypothetical protein
MRPPKRVLRFTASQVRNLINQHAIPAGRRWTKPAPSPTNSDDWSVARLAAELRMPTATIHNWIYRGWVTAHKDTTSGCWVITADAAGLERLRQRRARPAGYYTRQRFIDLPQPLCSDDQEPR